MLWANLAANRWIVIASAIAAGLLSGVNEDRFHMHKTLAVSVAIGEAAVVGAACVAVAAVVRRLRSRRRSRAARLGPAQAVEAR